MRRCEISGCSGYCYGGPHHFKTRGAHGEAALIPENEIYICASHHSESHDDGQETFALKYGLVERLRRAEEAVWELERLKRLGVCYENSSLAKT